MSKAARKQLRKMVEERGEMTFSEAVDEIERRHGVSTTTAETYVRDYCVTDVDEWGDRTVTAMKVMTGSDTAAQTDEDLDEVKAGSPTGDTYKNLPVLDTNPSHPRTPHLEVDYKVREIPETNRSDVDIVTKSMASKDFSTLLIGETGTGKDVLVRHICEKTNRPAVFVNFGVDTTYEGLVGMYTPSESGKPKWRDGLLTQAVRNGWVFVADELNAAHAEATMPLHGITQGAQDSHLTILDTGEVIEPHPEFKFVGTMNPEDYTGTNELNEAFKTRFMPTEIPYLGEEAEIELLTENRNISPSKAHGIVELANKLRRLQGDTIMTAVSTRELLQIAELSEDGAFMPIESATKQIILNKAKPSDRNAIAKAIESHRF